MGFPKFFEKFLIIKKKLLYAFLFLFLLYYFPRNSIFTEHFKLKYIIIFKFSCPFSCHSVSHFSPFLSLTRSLFPFNSHYTPIQFVTAKGKKFAKRTTSTKNVSVTFFIGPLCVFLCYRIIKCGDDRKWCEGWRF